MHFCLTWLLFITGDFDEEARKTVIHMAPVADPKN